MIPLHDPWLQECLTWLAKQMPWIEDKAAGSVVGEYTKRAVFGGNLKRLALKSAAHAKSENALEKRVIELETELSIANQKCAQLQQLILKLEPASAENEELRLALLSLGKLVANQENVIGALRKEIRDCYARHIKDQLKLDGIEDLIEGMIAKQANANNKAPDERSVG